MQSRRFRRTKPSATAQVQITCDILDHAAALPSEVLRSLDAIHLATADIAPELDTVIT